MIDGDTQNVEDAKYSFATGSSCETGYNYYRLIGEMLVYVGLLGILQFLNDRYISSTNSMVIIYLVFGVLGFFVISYSIKR